MPATPDDLAQEIRDATLLVHNAQERAEERDVVIAAHQGVDRVLERYRELVASLPEIEQMKIERNLGRRVTDLRRLASLLPRIGAIASSTPDRQVNGPSQVGERRITGVSWRSDSRPPVPPAQGVGGTVEAWCGPCGGLTEHTIVAMVGTEPKQVVCEACGARHGYRTTPARKTAGPVETAVPAPRDSEAVRRAEQKAEELRALGRELASAAEVRPFDPRGRYRAGEVISHPDFGRGKVDTVLRSSLLVRFSNGGLKSLILE